MEAQSCDIERLPEELLETVLSLTSPADACRLAAVSRTFRSTADSDAVWSRLLLHDLPEFADDELAAWVTPSKKALFQLLSDQPALLPCRRVVRTDPMYLSITPNKQLAS
jgi:hypothetical protein